MDEPTTNSELNTDLVEQVDSLVEVLTTQLEEEQLSEEEKFLLEEEEQKEQETMQKIGEDLEQLVVVLSEDNQNVLTETASTNELLMALTQEVEQMNTFLEEKSPIFEAGSSTVIGYGVLYVPLLLIILGLWWFFKQFLTDFR